MASVQTNVAVNYPNQSSSSSIFLERNKFETEKNKIKDESKGIKNEINPLNSRSTQTFSNTDISSATSVKSNEFIAKKLRIGMSDESVRVLQSMLSKDSEIYPEGRISGFYGSATVRAVKRFQKKYNLISDTSSSASGFGVAGPRTRRKLVEIFGGGATSQSSSSNVLNAPNLRNNFTVSNEQVEILKKILIELMKKKPSGNR